MSKRFSRITQQSGQHLSKATESLAQGRVVSSRFFRKYMVQTILTVLLLMIYIANRYDCVTGMETITRLRTQYQVVRTQLQRERSIYMTSIRESAIQHKADSLGLGLAIQQQPPYQLTYTPAE
ncbi:MAG: hypothetical protein K2F74_06295 [Muribaculaceae bacterium]|nr:hypothetical protein [Muribaculaceae bacterium]MDE5930166.1 hypothetical protein [Muribaculaceae bacterium]MDE6131183.1 hypothetical protein [Muribaculaceae bacterium]